MNPKEQEMVDTMIVIFAVVWIVSWYLSIWIFHIQFFLTGLLSLVFGMLYKGYKNSKKE